MSSTTAGGPGTATGRWAEMSRRREGLRDRHSGRAGGSVEVRHLEQGCGYGTERVGIEWLCFAEVDEVGRGHLKGLAGAVAGESAQLLGKGAVADELLTGYLVGGEENCEFPADLLVLSNAFGVPGRLVFDCSRETVRDAPLTKRLCVGLLAPAPESGTGLLLRRDRPAPRPAVRRFRRGRP